jgi:GNAT superfamily N-acetyltransferase
MFDSDCGHFCVLRANGRVIATHFGFRSGTLLHWGAPAFDIREAARSPSLLLIAILMMDLERWGLSGLDLTIGEGFLKERFSNTRVDLPSVDLYPTATAFASNRLITTIVAATKRQPRVMAIAERAADYVARARSALERHGVSGSLLLLARHASQSLCEFNTGLVLTITPETLSRTAPKPSAEEVRHGVNAYEDLLCWSGSDVLTDYTIRKTAESILSNAKNGRTLHTLVVGGKLACIGLSYMPDAPAQLTETGNLPLTFEAGSASLYSFYTVPEFRGRGLYQRLITSILTWHFAAGVKLAYITVLENNIASLRAIERVGFRRVQRNTVRRIGPLSRVRRVDF